MKKENGFTLVELLGVIAILSLVVLVAAPPIINQIKKSKNTFDKATLSLIYSAADSYVDNNQSNYPNINENTYCVTLDTLIKSGELKKSVIDIDKNSEIAVSQIIKITVNNNLYDYSLVEVDQCKDFSKPASPELSSGMIPIVHNGTNWVKADITSEWYNYSNKRWANAVLVTYATRTTYQNAVAGTVINEADVLAYLVWVPRYRYKLFNVEGTIVPIREIEIVFETKNENKSVGGVNDNWLTHPAFTFGDRELNGFWVGKFETTGNTTTPTIKPNSTALSNLSVSAGFATSQKFSNTTSYGLNSTNDAHLTKNMEWGAIAYLTQSKYGKNSEVWINPSNTEVTGCAGTGPSVLDSAGCPYAYTTPNGFQASTTGNIYGVYDMSGCGWEYVMGVIYEADNQTVRLGSSGFVQAVIDSAEMSKYIDKYQYGTTNNDQTAYNRRKLGDGTSESRGWNSDGAGMNFNSFPWFTRGGNGDDTTGAGIFHFNGAVGGASSVGNENTFRVVILGEE